MCVRERERERERERQRERERILTKMNSIEALSLITFTFKILQSKLIESNTLRAFILFAISPLVAKG